MGEVLYTQIGFFVQTILADQYNHCREIWVISLKSPSSVEYGYRKTFSIFAFYWEISRYKILWILYLIQLHFSHFRYFDLILDNFDKICQKIENCSVIDFISEDRVGLLNCSIRVFMARIYAKFFNFWHFRDQICFFSPLALKLPQVDTQKLRPNFF